MRSSIATSVAMVALVILSAVFGMVAWATYSQPEAVVINIKDSVLIARTKAELATTQYSLMVATSSADSLKDLLNKRVRSIRTVMLPGRVDTLIKDTGTTCVSDSALKVMLIADTTCLFKLDSTDGELVQCRYDLAESLESECKPPSFIEKTKSYALTFSTGYIAGYTTCAITQ